MLLRLLSSLRLCTLKLSKNTNFCVKLDAISTAYHKSRNITTDQEPINNLALLQWLLSKLNGHLKFISIKKDNAQRNKSKLKLKISLLDIGILEVLGKYQGYFCHMQMLISKKKFMTLIILQNGSKKTKLTWVWNFLICLIYLLLKLI